MEVRAAERRSTRRLQFKTALHVRVWKSGPTERRAESVNLSETGAFFATDAPIAIGSVIEILLKMAEEITGNPPRRGGASGAPPAARYVSRRSAWGRSGWLLRNAAFHDRFIALRSVNLGR